MGPARQYVFIGAILMGLAYVAMWQLHKGDGITYNFIYFLSWSLVFYLGLTIFSVPYVAMGYEISEDFHERTQIMAVAQFIGQWAWVIAPWFWVILYDPSWFPEGADAGVRELSVWVAIPCTCSPWSRPCSSRASPPWTEPTSPPSTCRPCSAAWARFSCLGV